MRELPLRINVVRTTGKGRGKKLGIPTLNFKIPTELTLAHGIYAGRLITDQASYKAAIHFGPRPVFNETDPSLEAYILDVHDLHDKTAMKLEFVAFVREIRHFSTPQDMLKQIDLDITQITKILG